MTIIVKKGKSLNLKQIRTFGRNYFVINKEYQRSQIWKDNKKQLLLDSIIRGLPIGTFILKKREDGPLEVLDGQQRIDSIFCFIDNEFKTSAKTKLFPEKNWDDLCADAKLSADFDSYTVFYDEIEGDNDQEIAEIFMRLQEGTPLNSAERLNATVGKMRDFVFKLSNHPLFKSVKISEWRFAHRLIAAQITLLELESDFNHTPYPEFPNLRFPELKTMYKEHCDELPSRLHKRVFGTMDTLFQSLGADARVIRKKSDMPLVYLLTSYLRKKFVLDFRLLNTFIVDFFTTVAQARIKQGESPRNLYEQYLELRKKGLTPDTFSERFRILLGLFLTRQPTIHLKDEKRSFDVGQKLAIYYHKDKKICQKCSKEVDFNDADFHHKTFYSKGGPTTVDNGQLMHISCHRKLHEELGINEE